MEQGLDTPPPPKNENVGGGEKFGVAPRVKLI